MSPFLIIVTAVIATTPADSWQAFRGTGNSISDAEQLPLKWSDESGIAWKAPLPGYGQSSPVIWQDRVFLTSTNGANKENVLVACFHLISGKPLWTKSFPSSQTMEVSNYVSRAAPTPAVDADCVFAFFETGNLIAFTHQGEIVWQRSLTDDYGKFLGNHGLGSSIAITDSALIILVDHDGPSYLLAVDKATGKTVWKNDRPKTISWCSPIVSGNQILVSSNGNCEAFDLKTGVRRWIVREIEGNTVPSATASDKLVIVGSSQLHGNFAIRRGGQNDISDTHIAWRSQEATATFSSPLLYRGHVYLVNRAGVAFCLDENTGETLWKQRIGGSCWASPLGGCERIYFFEKSGKTTVVGTANTLNVLTENSLTLQDRVYGVAAVEGIIIVRTGSELICVAESGPN